MSDERLRELYASATRTDARGAECPAPEAIEALVLRRGTEAERLATLDHVMTCAACRHELELLRSMATAARELDPGSVGDAASGSASTERPALRVERGGAETARRGWPSARRWMPIAIAAVILVAIGLPVSRMVRRAPETDTLRGVGGMQVRLVSPAAGATVSVQHVTFTWHAVRPRVQYVLELVDADGRVVATRESTDTVLVLASSAVPTGTYDWWVRLGGSEGSAAHSELRRVTVTGH